MSLNLAHRLQADVFMYLFAFVGIAVRFSVHQGAWNLKDVRYCLPDRRLVM
jgi:hypothetical protein